MIRLPASLRVVALGGCGGAQTFAYQIPPATPIGLVVFYGGFTVDVATASLVSVTEVRSLVTVP